MQTLEATIDERGTVNLLKAILLPSRRRALVTILDEDWADSEDLAPPQTTAQMAAAHRVRAARLASGDTEYTSVDLPFVDDGADW